MNESERHQVTTTVNIQFSRAPDLRFADVAVIAPAPVSNGPIEEFLADVTGADRLLATDPYYVLCE